uniref:Uncharacterized protein n=1 Tax=Cucumis melo TaxID=3656 RepID=A0A9I9EME8_CUCME
MDEGLKWLDRSESKRRLPPPILSSFPISPSQTIRSSEKNVAVSGFITRYPWSMRTILTLFLLPSQWPQPQNEELLLAMEESEFEEKSLEVVLTLESNWHMRFSTEVAPNLLSRQWFDTAQQR